MSPGARLPFAGAVGLLLVLGAGLLLPQLGTAPIERAEIYFMDGARAMVERGDYLVPRYKGEPFFDKPPLTYWLMAASFRSFGFTTAAARLVAAVAALGLLLGTVWVGGLLFDRRSALAGGVVLATTLAFMTFGRVAMSDMLLALWTNLAVGLGLVAWRRKPPPWSLPALATLLGLGFLTKGPIGVIFPGIGLALLARWRREEWPRWPASAGLLALLAFTTVGLGWFVALLLKEGPAPLSYFFLRENLERFAGGAYDAGQEPWFYLGAYLVVGLPWSPFLAGAATLAIGRRSEPAARFLAGWVALMLVPLSLSRGKVDYYLLPLYPAVSLLIGRYLGGVTWDRRDRTFVRVALTLLAGTMTFIPFALGRIPMRWLPGSAAQTASVVVAAAGAAALVGTALRPTPPRVLLSVGGSAAVLFCGAVTVFLPAFRAGQPNEAILADVRRERAYRPDAGLVLCRDAARVQRDILFHGRIAAQERCDVWNPASSRAPFLMLLQAEERESLAAIPGLRVISEHEALPGRDLTLGGLLRGPQPERVIVAANYDTTEPVAEAKRKKERRKAILAADEDATTPEAARP